MDSHTSKHQSELTRPSARPAEQWAEEAATEIATKFCDGVSDKALGTYVAGIRGVILATRFRASAVSAQPSMFDVFWNSNETHVQPYPKGYDEVRHIAEHAFNQGRMSVSAPEPDEREAFEKLARSRGWSVERNPEANDWWTGKYRDYRTEEMRLAWQAGAAWQSSRGGK